MERPTAWKLITLGAALTGFGFAGAGVALADTESGQPASPRTVAVSSAEVPVAVADASPESADSPFESPVDSADSPFDSPDDLPGHFDDTPFDTPDDDRDD
jgi:hypothetical protein